MCACEITYITTKTKSQKRKPGVVEIFQRVSAVVWKSVSACVLHLMLDKGDRRHTGSGRGWGSVKMKIPVHYFYCLYCFLEISLGDVD